jgi:hypothetical protein
MLSHPLVGDDLDQFRLQPGFYGMHQHGSTLAPSSYCSRALRPRLAMRRQGHLGEQPFFHRSVCLGPGSVVDAS